MASDKRTITLEFKALTSEFDNKIKISSSTITNLNAQLKLNAIQLKNDSSNVDLLKNHVDLLNSKLNAQKEETEALKGKLEVAKKTFGENSKEVELLANKILYATTAEERIKNEIDGVNNKITEQSSKMKESQSASSKLKETIEEQKNTLQNLKSKYTDVVLEEGKNSNSAKNLKKEMNTLNKELSNNSDELKKAETASDKFTSSLEELHNETRKSEGSFTVFKGILSNLGSNVIQGAISKVQGLGKEIVSLGKNFDTSISKIQAISGATDDEMEKIEQKARELGSSTKFSATEVGDAFQYMSMAGWKTEDMLNSIEGVLNLSAASGEDLATTSDIVTDALTAFGLSASGSSHFSDILATASSNANTNVSLMGETFKYVAPVAGALSYSAEDTAMAIGLMANAGIKGSQAGTSLRAIMSSLSAPTKTTAAAMEQLNLSITNSDGTMKPFGVVIEELREKFNGLSEAEQAEIAKNLAGQEAMSGLLSIVNAAPADYEKLSSAIGNCDGAAEQMASTMQDNLEGDMTTLKSKSEELGLSIYAKLEGPLRGAIQFMNGSVIPALTWGINNLPVLGTIVGGVSAAILANKLATEGLTAKQLIHNGVTKGLTITQRGLNAVMNANPISLVIIAITALIAIFILLWNKCEGFRNFWKNIWEAIPQMISSGIEGVKHFFGNAVNFFKEKIDWLKNLFFSFGHSVGDVIGGAFKGAINGALSIVENILNFPIRSINGLIDKINAIPGINLSHLNEFSFPRLKGGMSRVPSDYYPVYLDEGERVLTKEENEAYNRVGGLVGLLNNQVSTIISQQTQTVYDERIFDYLERIANKDLSLYVDSQELARTTAEADDQVSGEVISLKDRGLEM